VASAAGDPRLVNAGIMAKLDLNENLTLPKNMKLCVWTDDPEFGRSPFGNSLPALALHR
jgi:hypothetical protein